MQITPPETIIEIDEDGVVGEPFSEAMAILDHRRRLGLQGDIRINGFGDVDEVEIVEIGKPLPASAVRFTESKTAFTFAVKDGRLLWAWPWQMSAGYPVWQRLTALYRGWRRG